MTLLSLIRIRLSNLGLCLLVLLLSAKAASAQNVILPLTLDHRLLTSLLVQGAFQGEGRTVSVVGEEGSCMHVQLSEPDFSTENELLRLEMKLYIRAGKEFGDNCLMPVSWQGYIELLQKPNIVYSDGKAKRRDFALSFKTVDSRLLTLDKKPAKIAGFLWEFAKPEVYGHLNKVRIDLAPPLEELRAFLAPLFHEEAREATSMMLDSLRPGGVDVKGDRVEVELFAEVEEVFDPEDPLNSVPMSEEERQLLVRLWETWDAFLVHLLTILAVHPLQPEDQQVLVDVLLKTRHHMVAALDNPKMNTDLIRVQFLYAWERLAPVFRRQLYSRPSSNSLGYLAFFTAADALSVLDKMGPTLGIEISEQGFLRLARMLSGNATPLPYNSELDERLRDLFQLLPSEESSLPQIEQEEIDLPPDSDELPLSFISNFFLPPLYAGNTTKLPGFNEILKWKVPRKNYHEYFLRIRNVLSGATEKILIRQKIPSHLHSMYTTLIPAMAWQESCFRQFIVKKKKLTYLLSYNNTSVGLMQINERIWRGLYDRQRLRWDINYNALAGCEIVELYLSRYVLRHDPWNDPAQSDLLARVIYSMYNGGPGQYKKFLARERSGEHYQSDRLFSEKLQWTLEGQWDMVQQCFLGG